MHSSWQMAARYLRFWYKASNAKGHGMHSPFVFDFILHVLHNRSHYQHPPEIEQLRRRLLQDHRMIPVVDLGAGSRKGNEMEREVAALARSALKPPRLAQMLFRAARHYQPASIIELGTSLGITTAYFSKAVPAAHITTIEGSSIVARLAAEHLQELSCTNVTVVNGNFDEALPLALDQGLVDMAYVDGNHRYEPTIRYFEWLVERAHEGSVMIFDDIHWSAEMEKAWEVIRNDRRVCYSIDLFFLGFIFFRPAFRVKQNFSIRF
jgi:predicted O-methyltransferase YrrM